MKNYKIKYINPKYILNKFFVYVAPHMGFSHFKQKVEAVISLLMNTCDNKFDGLFEVLDIAVFRVAAFSSTYFIILVSDH